MSRRTQILGLNWKMNPPSREQATEIIQGMAENLSLMSETQLTIFPPALFFDHVKNKQNENSLYTSLGVQDISTIAVGSLTGEISAPMAIDSGAEFTLVGHSETRRRQGLSDEEVAEKMNRSIEHYLLPFLCVGYQEDGAEEEVDYEAIKRQVNIPLSNKQTYIRENGIIIAYEPTWAIGTGNPADPETIETVCLYIRKLVAEIAGQDMRDSIYVLYGGSVNSENVDDFLDLRNLDGFLLGGASLKPQEVATITRKMEE